MDLEGAAQTMDGGRRIRHDLRVRAPAARLLQLWWLYAKMDFLWMTQDWRFFITAYLSDALTLVASVTTTLLLAARFSGIGHWSFAHVIFMLAYATMIVALQDTLFSYNVAFISRRIGRGQLDHILIQPLPMWVILLTEGFSPVLGSGLMISAGALLVWSMAALPALPAMTGPVGTALLWLALLVANVLGSLVILLSFAFVSGSLAFWAPRSAEEINSSTNAIISNLKVFPLDGMHPALLTTMLSVVPVGFIAWYPSRALLGLDPWPLAPLVTPLAALASSAVAGWLFHLGMRQYGRTGSQRYLSHGHRR